ncbi:ABC transporter permease [Paenibacillus methanolicus]|uniref:Putative ABC transport system permease protein n=1 Tax=Paenibacillus methanolicus TaxID=582686 RepID=A0A5S5CAY3_9BACL|nr:ABC transporter permease [Paenibacillus methanolicus]TYP76477.1 putative ABC transport system permease protein [Paenibacillus methanolicus]
MFALLARKLIRDVKQSVGSFIAFVLVVAVGAFFYAGLVTYSSNLNAFATDYFKAHNLSDLNVYYDRITEREVAKIRAIEGISHAEGRYTFDAAQAFEDDKATLKIHSIPANNTINTPAVLSGSLPTKKGEILLDAHYAKEHQYRVGDRIQVRVNERDIAFTISGLGENAEHAKKNDIQDHQAYGVAYMAEASIPEVTDGFAYNEILIDARDGFDIDRLGESIEDASTQHRLPFVAQEPKERTFSYAKIQETIRNNQLMSRVIPFVLFLIEAMILFLAMSRMLDAERKQVGIMKALGVRDRTILLHYMGYPVLVGIIGSIIGWALAAAVFVPFVSASSARAYSLPGIEFALSPLSIAPPILVSSAFGMLACYLSARSILRERAAQAMRPKPPKSMKKLLVERVPGLWSRLPYRYKLILRNVFTKKGKALASAAGVVMSTVLLITAFGTQTALLQVADQIEEANTYDLRIDYAAGAMPESLQLQLPAGIASSYLVAEWPAEYRQADAKELATLTVTERENRLLQFMDANKNSIRLDNNGVLVPQSYADQYGIAIGDTVQLLVTTPERSKPVSVDMKVASISAQYSDPSFYCTPAYLAQLGIAYSPTSLLIEADRAADVPVIRTFFEQDQRVEAITDQQDLKKSAQYIVQQNSFVFVMFIVCAAILSFGAIYTISSINIYERQRELATLKVLGYQRNQINRLVFVENSWITVLSVIVALPISGYVFAFIIEALSSTHQQIPDQLNMAVILAAVALSFLLTFLSSLLLRRKVSGIRMIEALKAIE